MSAPMVVTLNKATQPDANTVAQRLSRVVVCRGSWSWLSVGARRWFERDAVFACPMRDAP